MIFKEEDVYVGGLEMVTTDEDRVDRDQITERKGLAGTGSEDFICKRQGFIFNAFIYFQPVKRLN